MIAEPISKYPMMHDLYRHVCQKQGTCFNIGVDCIIYRDGQDSIGWHADDTQNEDTVLSLIVDSDPVRVVKIKSKVPKDCEHPKIGAEEIKLFPRAGDAYVMDGKMQDNYVHCLPKMSPNKGSGRRLTLIFRSGDEQVVASSKFTVAHDTSPSKKSVCYAFGSMNDVLVEGAVHTKQELVNVGAHG